MASLTTATLDTLRARKTALPVGVPYFVTDTLHRGLWAVADGEDRQTPDDGATCIICKKTGQRVLHLDRQNEVRHVSWYGIVPSGSESMHENSARLDKLIKDNPYATIVFDQPGIYVIGHNEVNRGPQDRRYCIDLIDFHGTFTCATGAVISWEKGYDGIQLAQIRGGQTPRLIGLVLRQEGGMENYALRPGVTAREGEQYTQDWGDYRGNAINAWSGFYGRDLDIGDCAGNGIFVFGMTGMRINGAPFPISGTLSEGMFEGLVMTLDDDETFQRLPGGEPFAHFRLNCKYNEAGELVSYDERLANNVGASGPRTVSLGKIYGLEHLVGQRVTGEAYHVGIGMQANSIVIEGINNIQRVGAAGIYLAGNEANQGRFDNFRISDTGGPAVEDKALLKSEFPGLHTNNCVTHFTDYSTNPPTAPFGPFTNGGDRNVGSTLIKNYREDGQALDTSSSNTLYLGGFFGHGTGGGHGIVGRKLFGVWMGRIDGVHVELTDEGFQIWNGSTQLGTLTYEAMAKLIK